MQNRHIRTLAISSLALVAALVACMRAITTSPSGVRTPVRLSRSWRAALARSSAPSDKAWRATWEHQSTWKQLVALIRLHGIEPPPEGANPQSWDPAWQALQCALPKNSSSPCCAAGDRADLSPALNRS